MRKLICKRVNIPEDELEFIFILGSGPGGQNKNKVASVAQLRFNLRDSPSLSREMKGRLANLAGARINQNGEIIITAGRYRSQIQNREDAIQRFYYLIEQASRKPKARLATQPGMSVRLKRLEVKKKRGLIKKQRKYTNNFSE